MIYASLTLVVEWGGSFSLAMMAMQGRGIYRFVVFCCFWVLCRFSEFVRVCRGSLKWVFNSEGGTGCVVDAAFSFSLGFY